MGTTEGLCKPPMVLDFQGSHTSKEPPGSDNSHSSSMEGQTLVPCSARDAIQLPLTATLLTKSIPAGVRHETDGATVQLNLNLTLVCKSLKKYCKILVCNTQTMYARIMLCAV